MFVGDLRTIQIFVELDPLEVRFNPSRGLFLSIKV